MNLVAAGQLFRRRAFGSRGGAILWVVIALALVAIVAGVIFSVLEHGVKDPIAFDEVGPGKMAGNLCTNDFFGFSIEVPETWHAMSKSNLAGYLRAQEGSDVFNVAPILVAFKHGDDVPETDAFDPSLIVGAERLSNVPGVRTAREYLQDVKSSPDEEGFYKEDLKGPFSCLVGGQRFYGLDGKGQLEGTTMNTRLLVSVRKDYFFVIATAWESEEDGKVLADALKTVRFR